MLEELLKIRRELEARNIRISSIEAVYEKQDTEAAFKNQTKAKSVEEYGDEIFLVKPEIFLEKVVVEHNLTGAWLDIENADIVGIDLVEKRYQMEIPKNSLCYSRIARIMEGLGYELVESL